jgi:hypothetical protein
MSHIALQNGDWMRDPDLVFELFEYPTGAPAGTRLATHAAWNQKHRDSKGFLRGAPSMLKLDATTGAMILVPVSIVDRFAEPVSFRNGFLGTLQEVYETDDRGPLTARPLFASRPRSEALHAPGSGPPPPRVPRPQWPPRDARMTGASAPPVTLAGPSPAGDPSSRCLLRSPLGGVTPGSSTGADELRITSASENFTLSILDLLAWRACGWLPEVHGHPACSEELDLRE